MPTVLFIAACVVVLYLVFGQRKQSGQASASKPSPRQAGTPARIAASPTTQVRLLSAAKPLALDAPSLAGRFGDEGDVAVRGMSGDYSVSVSRQTCTCQDFQARKGQPINSMGRFCKHLMNELNRRGAFAEESEWHQAIGESGNGGPIHAWILEREDSPPALMCLSFSKDWVNVFARTKRKGERMANATGKIKQFGWNIAEKRWSYGEAPPGARELRELLADIERVQ